MEENIKEKSANKQQRSFVCRKIQIPIFGVLIIVVFISLVTYGFISLNNRLKTVEEKKPIESVSTISQEIRAGRTKRSAKPILTARLTQDGREPAFVLRGPPGKSGRDGIPGTKGRDGRDGRDGGKGKKGDQGTPGQQRPQGISGQKGKQGNPGVSGVSYIQWGKKTCPYTGAKLVYEGHVGGSRFNQRGGGSNYICLSRNPTYEKYKNGVQAHLSYIYGAEYEIKSAGIFPSSLHDHDVPCVRCHVNTRATQMMIPGRNVCPAGWTREYKGYLMAEKHSHHRTMYTCVDWNPDYVRGTHVNLEGALFYFVEGRCGSLPCKPYVDGRELTCAVCTR